MRVNPDIDITSQGRNSALTPLPFFSGLGLKVPCAPKLFSSSFSYSTCTNDFGAATHNERRFQFRLGQSRVPSSSGFRG